MTPSERAALRALLAAGTDLPWRVGDTYLGEAWVWSEVLGYMRGVGAPPGRDLVHAPPARLFEAGQGDQALADSRLIAAAVNALPRLLDALDAAERQRDALTVQLAAARGALDEYRDGHVGSDLAAATLAGLDALRWPATVPPATDSTTPTGDR